MSMETQQAKSVNEQATQRIVTVVTTRGEKVKLAFEGTEWSELKKILERGGTDIEGNRFSSYNLHNMKCVESTNRTTLEHPKAVVPDGNFNLFLMPYKSKSGAMSRSEINAAIKEHIAADGEKAKAYFTVNGKNYTQVGSAKLEELLESYKPGTRKASLKARAEATANVADVVASVKDAKETELFEELQGLTTDEKLDIVIKLLIDLKSQKSSNEGTVTSVTEPPVESESERQARLQREEEDRKAKEEEERKKKEAEEKKKADEAEKRKLQSEMENLMEGFDDVKRY